ncbi:hypothetical protein DQ04_02351100 [Trypanosoma grayi]|uniref:hypothetical protein n=1 Tax=Trypanosoma grayi TaxID=71804 RepID=UPI0004F408F8|nr:hypothetical protein DQ04_02351100 [Trypanosoma grayi]KEG11714.1 hypothetical protein DQ04_02351100 [Trypanosoma grayi]
MGERELITLALGNFASLVAAQWANGTTRYDTTRQTLYGERRIDAVQGGESLQQQQRTGATVRVPRLVLLDAPHATRLKRVRCTASRNGKCDNEEEEEGASDARVFATGDHTAQWESSSSSSSSAALHDHNDDEEEEMSAENGYSRTVYHDPNGDNDVQMSLKAIKHELFQEKDELVPWWRYIRSGVRNDSVHVLHPLHALGGGSGDVPLLHSFGFGMAQLRPSMSNDIAGVTESLRRQLEDADLLQGVQCFVDGDSAFGGAACNIMQEFWEDAGPKVPAVLFTPFQPLPEEVLMRESEVDFASRRKDEMCLNRLLATSHMTRHDSAVYVPLELAQWQASFAQPPPAGEAGAAEKAQVPAWIQNDTATAQLIAAVADSALYGARDNGSLGTNTSGPAFYLQDWKEAVRPTRSLRVSAALAAIPLPVYNMNSPRNDLWEFLERNPLFSLPQSAAKTGYFAPLTHATTLDPQTEAGRVLGHAVTLRGAGNLLDLTYPRQEALLRYGLPLRTANYLPLVTSNSYPISSTFPQDFVVPKEILASGVLEGIDVGAHIVSTYGSAPMLQSITAEAQTVLRHRRHLYEEAYSIEGDEWREVMEDVLQIRDDYDHRDDDDGDYLE